MFCYVAHIYSRLRYHENVHILRNIFIKSQLLAYRMA